MRSQTARPSRSPRASISLARVSAWSIAPLPCRSVSTSAARYTAIPSITYGQDRGDKIHNGIERIWAACPPEIVSLGLVLSLPEPTAQSIISVARPASIGSFVCFQGFWMEFPPQIFLGALFNLSSPHLGFCRICDECGSGAVPPKS